mgnify:CR=1 FL=1
MTKCVVRVHWTFPNGKTEDEYYIIDLDIDHNKGIEHIHDQISNSLQDWSWESVDWQIVYI